MAVVETHEQPPRVYPGGRSARVWRWTVGTGVALVVLAAVHMIAQHFVVEETGGLRTYHQVLEYLSNPVIFAVECGFLFTVTIHALLGVRGVLLDFDFGARARRRIDAGLWIVGTLTIAYGLVLLITLATRA
jgi:succinate dehydrogenase hydrophobic anchor subunit